MTDFMDSTAGRGVLSIAFAISAALTGVAFGWPPTLVETIMLMLLMWLVLIGEYVILQKRREVECSPSSSSEPSP